MDQAAELADLKSAVAKLTKDGAVYQREIENHWWRIRALEQAQGIQPANQIEMKPSEKADLSFTEIKAE